MIYNSAKIKQLLNSIEDNLAEEQQSIVKEIVSNYNKLYILAKEKIEYIKRKEETYLKESEENYNLKQQNKDLKIKNEMLKKQNSEQRKLLEEKNNKGGK